MPSRAEWSRPGPRPTHRACRRARHRADRPAACRRRGWAYRRKPRQAVRRRSRRAVRPKARRAVRRMPGRTVRRMPGRAVRRRSRQGVRSEAWRGVRPKPCRAVRRKARQVGCPESGRAWGRRWAYSWRRRRRTPEVCPECVAPGLSVPSPGRSASAAARRSSCCRAPVSASYVHFRTDSYALRPLRAGSVPLSEDSRTVRSVPGSRHAPRPPRGRPKNVWQATPAAD